MRSKHSRVSPMWCVTCSMTCLHPASQFQSRCRTERTYISLALAPGVGDLHAALWFIGP